MKLHMLRPGLPIFEHSWFSVYWKRRAGCDLQDRVLLVYYPGEQLFTSRLAKSVITE